MAIRGFSKDERAEILKQALVFWDDTTEYMAPYFNLVNELERLANVKLPREIQDIYDAFPDRAQLVPADIFNNLNSLISNIRGALFKKKPYLKFSIAGKPNLRDQVITKAEQVQQAMFDMAQDGKGFPAEAGKAIWQALYGGVSGSYLEWTDQFIDQPFIDEDGRIVNQKQHVASYAEAKSLDIRRMRIDPAAGERKDIRIVGYHSLDKFSHLRELNRTPGNHYEFDESELEDSNFQREKYFEYVEYQDDNTPEEPDEQDDFGEKIIEVYSIRGIFRLKNGNKTDYRDLHVEVGNRKELLALKDNDLPFPSYELFDYPAIDEIHGKLYTMGVVEPARDAFIELFIKENQSIDAANRNVYLTLIGDANACENLPNYIESSNDQLLKIDLQASGLTHWNQAIGVLQRPELGQDTFGHSQVQSRKVQQIMRLSDYLQGKNPESTETATAVMSLVSGGQELTDYIMEKLTDTYFRPLSRKMMILWNRYNLDRSQKVYGADGNPMMVNPGEINFPYVATTETNISMTNPGMVRRWVESYPIVSNDPYYDPMVVRQTHNEILDLPNKDRLLVSHEKMEDEIENENLALKAGLPQIVNPLHNHNMHIPKHAELVQSDPANQTAVAHLQAHQQYQMQEQNALGNTKEMGGNVGNLVQGEAASMGSGQSAPTGAYMPSEGRA